jgi:hypothetical protein
MEQFIFAGLLKPRHCDGQIQESHLPVLHGRVFLVAKSRVLAACSAMSHSNQDLPPEFAWMRMRMSQRRQSEFQLPTADDLTDNHR